MRLAAPAPVLLAAALASGCSDPSPERSFAEMQEAACEEDAVRFFSYIDRDAVVSNVAILLTVKEPSLIGREDMLKERARDSVYQGFEEWAENIKRGGDSKLCKLQRHIWQDVDWVKWVDGDGVARRSRFEKAGDKFLVVEMRPAD